MGGFDEPAYGPYFPNRAARRQRFKIRCKQKMSNRRCNRRKK